jgi:hypothetical protein
VPKTSYQHIIRAACRRSWCLIGALAAAAYVCLVAGDSIGQSVDRSVIAGRATEKRLSRAGVGSIVKRINFIYRPLRDEHRKTALNQQTPTPKGWEAYDGSAYTPERGYRWLTNLRGVGRDRGVQGIVVLADGTKTSPEKLNRPELANFAKTTIQHFRKPARDHAPQS